MSLWASVFILITEKIFKPYGPMLTRHCTPRKIMKIITSVIVPNFLIYIIKRKRPGIFSYEKIPGPYNS